MNDWLDSLSKLGGTAAGVIGAVKGKGTAKTTVAAGNQNNLLIPIALGIGALVLVIGLVLALRK